MGSVLLIAKLADQGWRMLSVSYILGTSFATGSKSDLAAPTATLGLSATARCNP